MSIVRQMLSYIYRGGHFEDVDLGFIGEGHKYARGHRTAFKMKRFLVESAGSSLAAAFAGLMKKTVMRGRSPQSSIKSWASAAGKEAIGCRSKGKMTTGPQDEECGPGANGGRGLYGPEGVGESFDA